MFDRNTYPHFLFTEISNPSPENAFFHIIPAPYEKTTSYGKGTAKGPSAILNASGQLEIFDGKSIPADLGIYTQPPADCEKSPEKSLNNITKAVGNTLGLGKFPVILGGEHTITHAVVRAYQGESIGVVHFDAHADLRDAYEDTPLSHACAIRRILEMQVPVFQIGVRSMSPEEALYRKKERIPFLDAETIMSCGFQTDILPESFPKKIFITLDVDVLDPSVMPATGTPEPGGLTWYLFMDIVRNILKDRTPVGMDIVEFSPLENMNVWDFVAARLTYNLMGIISRRLPNQ